MADLDWIDELIAESSLGTPEAHALAALTPPGDVRRIAAQAAEHDRAERPNEPPEAGAAADVVQWVRRIIEEVDLEELRGFTGKERWARLSRVASHVFTREGPFLGYRARGLVIRRMVDVIEELLGPAEEDPSVADPSTPEMPRRWNVERTTSVEMLLEAERRVAAAERLATNAVDDLGSRDELTAHLRTARRLLTDLLAVEEMALPRRSGPGHGTDPDG